jgi:hypothetical protein
METLRVDPANEILGLRVNLWVMGVALVAASAWFVSIQRREDPPPREGRRVRAA